MTQERREDRVARRRSRDDDGDREHHGRRKPRAVVVFTFAVNGRPKAPEVRGERFRLGDIIATSDGPHKVIEVFWFSDTKARVLLRPMPPEKAPEKPKKQRKFNVKGTQTGRAPARHQNHRSRPRSKKD